MKAKLFATAAAIFCISIASVNAQVKNHAQNQHQRIKSGVKNGELTRLEAKNLINDQKDIRQDIKLAGADGDITRQEKKIITKEQAKASREIYVKKHNRRDRN
ncbi:MAG: hypothetical protein ABIQ56_00835 [Chitinophagaceae bacterium]